MPSMFLGAEAISFNDNLSQWDVSKVVYIDNMFNNGASAFDQTLCGKAWVGMKATNTDMFLVNVPQLVGLAVRAFTRCWDG